MKFLIFIVLIAPTCKSISDWRPVLHPDLYPNVKGHHHSEPSFSSLPSLIAQSYQQPGPSHGGGQCELYKVGFTQDLYFQYIQYKVTLPEMKEFTLCYWSKFNNHSNDHPIFSYAVDGQPKSISAWVSNTDRSSYYSLAVEGHTFYRLNYPLRLNRWYHTCQSWNGRTGEWQIWVNAERVGRGFHNRLVGHHIPAGGIAITGQEQTQYGGGFLEGVEAPKGAGGMLGEVTMVQLYHVALTAGKAHRDHKHHHAHTFDHNGMPITTTPPAPRPLRPMTATHPLLTGGQLNPNVALTIASGQTPQLSLASSQLLPQFAPGQYDTQLLNDQFVNSFVQQQVANTPQSRAPQTFNQDPLPPVPPQAIPQQQQAQYLNVLPPPQQQQTGQPLLQISPETPLPQLGGATSTISVSGGLVHPSLINPANAQFIDTQLETHQLFKRHSKNDTKDEGTARTERTERKKSTTKEKSHVKFIPKTTSSPIDPLAEAEDLLEKKHTKRELYLEGGALIDDGSNNFDHGGNNFDQSLLDGLAGIGQNQPVLQLQKQYEEREPAEAEVAAVMNVCSGCDQEPFAKALVIGWRTVPKKLYSGAFYTPALPQCKAF